MAVPKTTSTKVLFYLCGNSRKASSRVRGFWIAESLDKIGFKCTLRWRQRKLNLIRFALEIPKNDAIIFQKTYSRYHRWLMALAKHLGKRTYLDLDDTPSRTRSKTTLKNVESMMRMANGVFAGSQNLFDYASQYQSRVYLIPSGVNLDNYSVGRTKKSKELCLGWIGNGAHYANDLLEILEGPLRQLAVTYRLRFKLVGACGVQDLYATFGNIPSLQIDFIDQIDWSNPVAVSEAIQDFDIGLYPLLPSDFNIYKCGFKALEYMASGIPVVSSSVAVNKEIINIGGNGFLADSETEWVIALTRLIEDADLRSSIGRAGRRTVEEQFDVTKIAKRVKDIVLETPRNSGTRVIV